MSRTSKSTTANSGLNQIQSLKRELGYLKRRLKAHESVSYYRTSTDIFAAIFDQSSQFAAVLDPDGTVIKVNRALLDLVDATEPEVVGQRFWQMDWWVSPSTHMNRLQEMIIRVGRGELVQQQTNQPTRYETQIGQIRHIGETIDRVITLELVIQPIRNQSGQVISVLVEGRNITQQHIAQQHIAQPHIIQQYISKRDALQQSVVEKKYAGEIVERFDNRRLNNQIYDNQILKNQTLSNQVIGASSTRLEEYIVEQVAPLEVTPSDVFNPFAEPDISQGIPKQERRYAALAQVSPVGIFRADRFGKCVYVNDRLCQLSGLSPQDAVGTTWMQAIHPIDRDMVRTVWRRSIQDNQPFRVEFRYRRSNGCIIWVVVQVIAETTEVGEITGYVGSVIDITDRKQAELSTQESEERFRATFEQAAVGLSHVGLDGRWLRVNQKLCEIVGYSREELLQRTFQSITHPEDLDVNLKRIHQLLTGEIQTYCMEKRYLRKDGSLTWVNITVSLMRESSANPWGDGANGNPNYMIVVVEDINDRKQAATALQERAEELSQLNAILRQTTTLLEERNRELDQFAYVASHDLKAPLRAIANLSEWIEEDLNGTLPDENQQQLQLLRSRVHRMEALIHGLLEYSRAGRTQTTVDTVSVNTLLAEVIDSLAPPECFTIDIQPDMPTLTTRTLMLRQVFANLIGNAVKHHDRSNGYITVSACDRGKFYEFRVSDDGPGIAPENYTKVFGIFQTLTARDVKESTGIGLSIVKKIVETEGGKITLESEVGKGSTFRFTWLKQPK